jgi:hypothetical protein
MGLPNIREIAYAHCRFRLSSGREVFGVVWEGDAMDSGELCFTTIGEYERLLRDPMRSIEVVPMRSEEILYAERLAS